MQVDFGDQGESEHNLHLTANPHQHAHPRSHYEHPGPGSGPPYLPFRHPGSGGGGDGGGGGGGGGGVPAIDPALHQSTGASRNVHTPMSAVPHQAQSNHLLQPDNAGHFSHGLYGDMRSSQTPPASANASPRFSAISPTSQPRQVASHYEPSDRNPPARDVSDETIDDAYAAFILYCNPNFPTTIDTSELVKLFRTPPKSDGNAFSTWTLFELIRKFEAKEIKTWTQLALDLGVKPPNTDEGQSTQKVQQYSVRLKRWMRAMHIDAFFEYLMGKQHPYCLQIPPPHDPFPPQGRDGVILEEDLAIRALDPKFKPKRGRRKADDGEDDIDFDEGTPARKRPQLDTSIPFGNVLQPQSAYPTSAHPNNMHGGFLTQDPWTSVSAVTPSSALTAASAPSRLGHSNLTPYSASPMSGQQIRWRLNTENPQTPHPLSAVTPQSAYPFFDEPQSAVTPSSSRSRSRRRHGPAVSSAWSTNNSSSTGKLRGRPPSNRSIRDGPYVTFPANPKTKEEPPIDRNPGNLTPIVERAHSDPPAPENSFRFPPTPASAISPSKMEGPLPGGMPQKQRLSLQVPPNVGNPVVRLVTPTVLVNGEENQSPGTGLGPSPISAASAQVTPAHTYDQQIGFGLGGPTGGVRRVDCIRFRVGGDGYESPIDDEDEEAETSNDAQGSGRIKETFDVLFAVSFGGLSGEWIAKGLEASNESEADAESRDRGRGSKDTEGARNETNDEHWKSKYLEAQRKIWEMKEEVKSLKDRVLEAVL
ncbi:conserved hypothetical protein [Pyrenophora tritici-repentis Pt-1C-BFP]|uniref:Abp2 domain containing protein n=1 Tax=Pyrenophora tritici-repentis (strain Pt-1C-BFP) TaxID=426418 RepID=B2W2Z5_PYRTR|nr:uncharacterized protein PTRG_03793 [Pyrenophora tritici-repentis Pt-1C-BFP]EDU46631.1 conserved hypothetical protein [Pyrenophora tritici-repentis Pt-1C-BFP]